MHLQLQPHEDVVILPELVEMEKGPQTGDEEIVATEEVVQQHIVVSQAQGPLFHHSDRLSSHVPSLVFHLVPCLHGCNINVSICISGQWARMNGIHVCSNSALFYNGQNPSN